MQKPRARGSLLPTLQRSSTPFLRTCLHSKASSVDGPPAYPSGGFRRSIERESHAADFRIEWIKISRNGGSSAMTFWDVIKEMSAQPVRREASRLFVLALAGEADYVTRAREEVLGPNATPQQRAAAEPFLCTASPPYSLDTENRMRFADLLVSFPGGPGSTDYRPADTIQVEAVGDLKRKILERRTDLRIPMARMLPGLRDLAAEQIIRDVSKVNAEFAALSTITQSIPVVAPWFPIVAGADIVLLTKNQALMMFRLAAIYGESLDVMSRLREVAPVVGGAVGWRTIARELAGVLPGAMGLPIRAGIAYSGTYTVGRAAQMVFDQGRRPTREEMLRIYEESRDLAKDVVASLRERFRKPKSLEEPPKALPPGDPMLTAGTRRPEEEAEAEPRSDPSGRE